ncbi:MAG: hypothetical protein AB1679_03465 [Actinomycetota bacterium]|jgi:hypothetical protein
MEPQGLSAEDGGGDEVARRRRQRRAAVLNRPVPGCPTMTLGELAQQALAATAGAGGPDRVAQFLTDAGHSRETTNTILGCLDLAHHESPGAVTELEQTSAGAQRLRALARLEALLLKD